MITDGDRYRQAIQLLDAANAHDPHKVEGIAAELLYACRMTDWLGRLYPQASEALQLAARAQHIRRWEIPRNAYPITRAGYHQWRTFLYSFHAETAGKILEQAGYEPQTIARVKSLLRKEKLKSDPDTQALEDVICLVFLENYFLDFSRRHEEEKVVQILKRTWAKMSGVGRDAVMKLELPPQAKHLLEKALNS